MLIINLLFQALYILIIARVIISWIRVDMYHPTYGPIVRFIYQSTEPLLAPIRNALPQMGGLDFSPLILLLLVGFVRNLLFSIV